MKKNKQKKKGPRYARQRTSYSCGPTALINLGKWLGYRFSIKEHHDQFVGLSQTTPIMGTSITNFDKSVRRLFGRSAVIKKRRLPSYASIIGHLRCKNCAVVLLYWRPDNDYGRNARDAIIGHYTLVVPDESGKGVVCINDSITQTSVIRTKEEIKARLRFIRKNRFEDAFVWFIQG